MIMSPTTARTILDWATTRIHDDDLIAELYEISDRLTAAELDQVMPDLELHAKQLIADSNTVKEAQAVQKTINSLRERTNNLMLKSPEEIELEIAESVFAASSESDDPWDEHDVAQWIKDGKIKHVKVEWKNVPPNTTAKRRVLHET